MQVSVANIVAFLVHELRSARRSMRTWVFAAMAVGLGAGLYLYLFGAHGFGQTSAPRLNMPGYGALTLWVVHPKHMRVFEVLFAEVLKTTVSRFLRERLATTGLDYPHRALSVVEAPAQLRRYGGGWRMGTLQALPGVQMLAEHGLPTGRFSMPADAASTRSQDALLKRLDELGANRIPLSAGFAGNLLPFLTSATGDGAFALNYLLEALTARVALGAHVVAPAGWVHASVPSNSGLVRGLLRTLGTATVRSAWFEHVPESVETRGEGMAMNRIDPRRSPSDVDVLIHKGELLAALMEGVMGNRKTRAFLALMRQRHAGATFTTEDFIAALHTVGTNAAAVDRALSRRGCATRTPGVFASRRAHSGRRKRPAALPAARRRSQRRARRRRGRAQLANGDRGRFPVARRNARRRAGPNIHRDRRDEPAPALGSALGDLPLAQQASVGSAAAALRPHGSRRLAAFGRCAPKQLDAPRRRHRGR